jgi:hypothetical protein
MSENFLPQFLHVCKATDDQYPQVLGIGSLSFSIAVSMGTTRSDYFARATRLRASFLWPGVSSFIARLLIHWRDLLRLYSDDLRY